MKIFFDAKANLSLLKFGIQIPLTDKGSKVVSFLEEAKIPLTYLDDTVADEISDDLLSLAHNQEFRDKVSTIDGQKAALADTFELFDASGRPNRYDVKIASLPLEQLHRHAVKQVNGTIHSAEYALAHKEASFYLLGWVSSWDVFWWKRFLPFE